jgi:hypothetical protein
MSGGPESLVERGLEKEPPTKAGTAEAVLMGALAHGVNVSIFFPLLTCVSKLMLVAWSVTVKSAAGLIRFACISDICEATVLSVMWNVSMEWRCH